MLVAVEIVPKKENLAKCIFSLKFFISLPYTKFACRNNLDVRNNGAMVIMSMQLLNF